MLAYSILLVILTGLGTKNAVCERLTIVVNAEKPVGQTAITMLQTDMLAGVPGYFWANLTTSDVEQACRYLSVTGTTGVNANIRAGNESYSEDLAVRAVHNQTMRIRQHPSATSGFIYYHDRLSSGVWLHKTCLISRCVTFVQVTAMEYCDVTNKSPSGVQIIVKDQQGRSIAVMLTFSSCLAYLCYLLSYHKL